jgi:outer membrane protein TolC
MPIALTTVLVLAAPSPAHASALGLEEAVELALNSHEAAQIAAWQTEEARAEARQVWARVLPHLSVGGALGFRPDSKVTYAQIGEVDRQGGTTLSGRATVAATIVDIGTIPDLMRADRWSRAQELASAEAQRGLAYDVARQFLLVLTTEQLRVAAAKRVEVADATVRDAKQRVQAGAGRGSDVTRAELEQSAARLGLVETARDVDLARLTLGDLLGAGNADRARGALRAPASSLMTLDIDEADLGARAHAQRNDLKRTALLKEAARQSVWENLAGFLPAVTASVDVTKVDDVASSYGPDWAVALSLRWNIFEGGSRWAEDSRREAAAEIAALDNRQLDRAIDTEVATAARRLTASLAQLEEAKLQAGLAKRNLDETEAMFRHGLGTALERVDAIAKAFEADATLARRQLEARLAELGVLEAVGDWPVATAGPVLP